MSVSCSCPLIRDTYPNGAGPNRQPDQAGDSSSALIGSPSLCVAWVEVSSVFPTSSGMDSLSVAGFLPTGRSGMAHLHPPRRRRPRRRGWAHPARSWARASVRGLRRAWVAPQSRRGPAGKPKVLYAVVLPDLMACNTASSWGTVGVGRSSSRHHRSSAHFSGSTIRGSPGPRAGGEEEVDPLIDRLPGVGPLHGRHEPQVEVAHVDLLAGLAVGGVVRRLALLDVARGGRGPVVVHVAGVLAQLRSTSAPGCRRAAGRRTTRGRRRSGSRGRLVQGRAGVLLLELALPEPWVSSSSPSGGGTDPEPSGRVTRVVSGPGSGSA